MDKIMFTVPETGEEVEFYIIEQTKFNGKDYILVTETMDESEDEEAEAYVLKDISEESDTQATYIMVEDDKELDAVSIIFSELLEDIDLETE